MSTAIRAAALFAPLTLLAVVYAWRRGHRRRTTGALLAAAWNMPALLALNVAALQLGWWRFEASGGLLLGVPLDLLIGWSVLWGPLAALVFRRVATWWVLALLLVVDLVLMPACEPLVILGDWWLVGESVGLLTCALPGLLLARWVRDDRHLGARVALGMTAFVGITLGVFSATVFQLTGNEPKLSLSGSRGVLLQLVLLAAVPGLSAVQEFAQRGGGTPLPYDPPRRLVVSGPYAYVANPMQTSIILVFLAWGGSVGSAWIALGALVALAYGAGLASWHETAQLEDRYGDAFTAYRRSVRRWIPHFRPRGLDPEQPALIYIAVGCSPCEGVAGWIRRRSPRAPHIVPAHTHARLLTRMTYAPGDGGSEEDGLIALARALEHLHLGWAFLGWTIRLPGVVHVAQLLVDVCGGGPRPAPALRTDRAESAPTGGVCASRSHQRRL